jgi:hypothetical protein
MAVVSSRTIAVTFVVTPAPEISLSTASVSFSAVSSGTSPASQGIAITNSGGATLSGLSATIGYPAGRTTGWLTASLSSTTAPANLSLQAATGSLAAGTYTATVSIASAVASNSPRTITVTFQVTQPPSIQLSKTTVAFSTIAGGANPTAQTVDVTNSGNGALNGLSTSISYASSQPTGWLAASLGTTTAPATISISATTGTLRAGAYTATVSVASAAASNSPRTIAVTFNIGDAAPAAPSSLTATTASSSQINLAWTDNSDNETGFRVERCMNASCTSFAEIVITAANVRSYNDVNLAAQTTYQYRVRAYNGTGGNSQYSNTASATTQGVPIPAPTNLTATAVSSSQINLTWQESATNESGFRVERCSGPGCTNFTEIGTVGANVTSASNTGLQPSTSYSYRIRAYTATQSSNYSNTATAVTQGTEVERTFTASSDNLLMYNSQDATVADRVFPSAENAVGYNYFYNIFGLSGIIGAASLLKFDVQSTITGKTILEAKLILYQQYLPGDFRGTFRVSAVASSWNAGTVTWNAWSRMNSYGPGTVDFSALPSSVVPLELDITDIVKNWASGVFANNGLQLWDPLSVPPGQESYQAVGFYSLENAGTASKRPQLYIRYR